MTAPELQPFAATLRFHVGRELVAPHGLVTGLLDDVARRCEEAGCSLIGHIKCHVAMGGSSFSCSLTSRRVGASCRGDADRPWPAGGSAEVDLAVLVYGLQERVVRALVDDALKASAEATRGSWHVRGGGGHHHHG